MNPAVGPLVGVVVVNWNGIPQSRRCLASLLGSDWQHLRLCLVDNGSTDGSAAALQGEFPSVDVLALPANLGYWAACNAGITWAMGAGLDYVLLLNNDTTIDPAAIRLLADRTAQLQSSGTDAILAPKILYASAPSTVWSAGGLLRRPWLEREHVGMGDEDGLDCTPRQVTWASGCALFFPLAVADAVGPFDERYFLYLEDVDWCLRARQAGVPIWFVPEARLWHDVSLSVRKVDSRATRYYHARNYFMLARSHCGPVGRAWSASRIAVTLAKTAVRSVLFPSYRQDSYYQSQTRAILDFLRGRSGPAPYADQPPSPARPARGNERLA